MKKILCIVMAVVAMTAMARPLRGYSFRSGRGCVSTRYGYYPGGRHHYHGSFWGRGGRHFWPGFVGGVVGGFVGGVITPTTTVITPVVAPVYQPVRTSVWVPGRWVETVGPYGTVNTWQPGHYEYR